MAQMAADPKTREWWSITEPMQEPMASRSEGEWFDIEQITIGHLRAFIVEMQGTIADAENPYKPTNEEGRTISDRRSMAMPK
jgi:hypothetical protein